MMYEIENENEEKKDLVPDYEETEFEMDEGCEEKGLSTGAAVAIGVGGTLLGILVVKGVVKGVKKLVKIVKQAMAEDNAAATDQTEEGSTGEASGKVIIDAAE